MTAGPIPRIATSRWSWGLAFGLLALFVAARMGAFSLSAEVAAPNGIVRLPNTYASVDHPFHVARAETLWRELGSGTAPRWIGQHQGGYPVEFYPLGEAWLEVVIRVLSLGTLAAEGAHTLAVIALFLAPGMAFAALAHEDGWSPAVGLIALALHVSLPGGWYHGGYTELVQWGLVTNVAGAVAAFSMLPALVRFLRAGAGWAGASAAALAAFAIYCNPRSLFGLAALGLGAWLAAVLRGKEAPFAAVTLRLAQVAILAALLAAPELMALARFGDLYTFVQYSGYDGLGAYFATAVTAVSWPVLVLGLMGLGVGLGVVQRRATSSAAVALMLYVGVTAALVVVPAAAALAPQLEPTRLMPLQRLLTIYLAAVAVWMGLSWLVARVAALCGPSPPYPPLPSSRERRERPRNMTDLGRRQPELAHLRLLPPVAAVLLAAAILLIQTRPLGGPPPDPASPTVPPVGLYSVAMSGRPEQADLEAAVRAADEEVTPGTAMLVLGSALSWHQQLWASLWTERPLFYDNWLWYWRPDHVGTPGYAFQAGHHYPDPERTLTRDYLARHGIGAVVVTGPARETAAVSPLLRLLREGVYDAYGVLDPVTTLTFGNQNAASLEYSNQRIEAVSDVPAAPVIARVNWQPRWEATVDANRAAAERLDDGYLRIASNKAASQVELVYAVQPLDWAARALAATGIVGLGWLIVGRKRPNSRDRRWYPARLYRDGETTPERERIVMDARGLGSERNAR